MIKTGSRRAKPSPPSATVSTLPVLGASSDGPDGAHLQQVADQLNGAAPVPRTWEVKDGEWVRIEGSGGVAPTAKGEEGQVYDEGLGTTFDDVSAWLDRRVRSDLPLGEDEEDEDWSPEKDGKVETDDEEENGDDEADTSVDGPSVSSPSSHPDGGMTLEERRNLDRDAAERPGKTSLLTPAGPATRTMTTNDKFRKAGETMQVRSEKSGPVTIDLQEKAVLVGNAKQMRERPIRVYGRVEETKTKGRQGAPDPISGYQIYFGSGKTPKASIPVERNNGTPDAERGHVMALELGGPDIPENIVPQWAKFQGSGVWRQMEVGVLRKARDLKKGQSLHYSVDIFYKDNGVSTPTLRAFAVPTGFRAVTEIKDASGKTLSTESLFDKGQAQDVTDDRRVEKEFAKIDGKDHDKDLNIIKKKAKSKTKVTEKAEEATTKVDKPKTGRKKGKAAKKK